MIQVSLFALRRFILPLDGRVLFAALAILLLYSFNGFAKDSGSSNDREFDLKPGMIVFGSGQRVEKITIDNTESVLGSCEVLGELTGNSKPVYQKWGSASEFTSEGDVSTATGVLSADEKSGGEDYIKSSLSYKRTDAGQFEFNIEATYLKTADWKLPVFYCITVPIKLYEGGTLIGDGGSGSSKTFQIESAPSGLNGNLFRKVVLVKGDIRITIEAADLSRLRVIDGRSWGDNRIRIDVTASRKWAAVQHIEADEKDVFGAKVTLQRTKK